MGALMVLKYRQWQEPLAAAIQEFDAQRLRQKLQKAHEAIAKRLQQVASEKDNQDERRALNDGLVPIRDIPDLPVSLHKTTSQSRPR